MTNRSLDEPSHGDFVRLSKCLRKEKGIRELERITSERLKAQFDKGMMVFLFVVQCGCDVRKGHPLACAVLWETNHPDTCEMGTVWVHPNYRGRNHKAESTQKDVVQQLLELPAAQDKNLFAISLVPTFGEVVQGFGFTPETLETMPDLETWAEQVGVPEPRIPSSVFRPSRVGLPQGERILYLRFAGR